MDCRGCKNHTYKPNIIFKGKEPIDFPALNSSPVFGLRSKEFRFHLTGFGGILCFQNVYTRIRQKSVDLRKIVSTALDRNRKKYQLQEKQLKDTEKRDKYKVCGELIHTYGYGLEEGAKKLEDTELLHQRDDHHSARLTVRCQGKCAEIF